MSTEIVPSVVDFDNVTDLSTTVAMADSEMPINKSELIPATTEQQFAINTSSLNTTDIEHTYSDSTLFETFIIIEIVMTTLELIMSILAAMKIQRWRRNYRNQMLMQLTFARFMKRLILTFKFLTDHGRITPTDIVTNIIYCFQIYINFVIVILIFFFIKHMYNTLIIVIVKISQNSFYRVLTCSWLIPVPISAVSTTIIVTKVVDKWHVNLFICGVFRWPLLFLGTALYVTIVYRVWTDKIRKFARSLAVVTFLLCLTINVYLFSKDVIELWCLKSVTTQLIGYVSGLLMNLLILILYVILLIMTYNKAQTSRSLPHYSLADINIKC